MKGKGLGRWFGIGGIGVIALAVIWVIVYGIGNGSGSKGIGVVEIDGSVWFVDNEKCAVYLDTAAFRTYQEYVWQDGKGYLFLHHSVGLPWETDIYTVEENQPCKIFTRKTVFLDEDGQVMAE